MNIIDPVVYTRLCKYILCIDKSFGECGYYRGKVCVFG